MTELVFVAHVFDDVGDGIQQPFLDMERTRIDAVRPDRVTATGEIPTNRSRRARAGFAVVERGR
jgi:hypothetical protein